jgi:zinc protease
VPLPEAPRPTPGAPRGYAFPHFETRVLPNGVRLVVAPVAKLPLVTVSTVLDAGAMLDPAGKEGIAVLTARALTEGARGRDGAVITDETERLGTGLAAGADWDASRVRMTVLRPHLEAALRLMADVLLAPDFPEREIERLKGERIAELLQRRAEPRGLADEMLSRFLYAPGARYATPEGGDDGSVSALTRADVVAFYRARYAPDRATVIVVGDISVYDAERLVTGVLGAWRGSGLAPTTESVADRAAPGAPGGGGVHIVTKENAPQSELRIGHIGVARAVPDYFSVVVMNAILGGLFSSRINLNLREAHGYTYGAHSTFDWRRGAGPFAVSTAVQRDVTDAAAREILHEIARIRETDVAPDELSLATSFLDGVFPIRYETTTAIASALTSLVVYGLAENYFDTYRDNIRAQTVSTVRAAAQARLHADRLRLVVVGDPAVLRAPLEALGLGPVSVYSDRGELL